MMWEIVDTSNNKFCFITLNLCTFSLVYTDNQKTMEEETEILAIFKYILQRKFTNITRKLISINIILD